MFEIPTTKEGPAESLSVEVEITVEQLSVLAQELEELNNQANQGRGLRHIGYVIGDLRRGDLQAARTNCRNQSDKFGSIPEIEEWVAHKLFSSNVRQWKSVEVDG